MMKIKRGGAYVDASPFVKRGGVYSAVSAFVKSGSGYLSASSSGGSDALPPSYTEWTGADERYGYFASMVVGVNTPTGYELGRVAPYNLGDVWAISGDTAGLGIDASGVISITDSSLITEAGTRYVTIQRTDAAGMQQTTIPVLVVAADGPNMFVDEVDGDDANTGREPHIPKRTLDNAVTLFANSRTNTYLRRGVTFTGPLQYRSNRTYQSYGNPLSPNPTVAYSDATGMIHAIHPSYTTKFSVTNGWTITDIDASGAEVPVRLIQSHLFTIKRMHLSNNIDTANASGIRMSDMTGGGVLRFISTSNIAGDGIYGTFCRDAHANYEIGYCDFGVPAGAGADSIQFTHENNAAQKNYNVWIHHCIGRQDPLSTNLKGSVAIEGTENYLIEDCTFDCKYFAVGVAGNKGTIRRVTVPKGGLSPTNNNYTNTWGIGIGAQFLTDRISIYDNDINGLGVDGASIFNGIFISGYNLTGLNAERWNLEVNNNTIRNVTRSIKTVVPWSGAIRHNTAVGNDTNTVVNQGTVATQGVATQTVIENLQPASLPAEYGVASISGTIEEGQTVSVTANRPVTGYQWRLNGIPISGATSQSYTIPTGYSTSIDERKPVFGGLNAPELSCVVFFADGSTSAPTVRGIAAGA